MKTASAIIFSIAIVLAAIFLGHAYVERAETEGSISVTGLGSTDFTSDLIVWEGTFSRSSMDLKQAYADMEADKLAIDEYLNSKGIDAETVVYTAIRTYEDTRPIYKDGNYEGEMFMGYDLSRTVKIESQDVKRIEDLSREITELLNLGLQFYSQPPRYYYTKLSDLKIEMISMATEDARIRAEKIAENSGGTLGDLRSARMGVFQITGQNSSEEISWGGTFNTADKDKTATITMRLEYEVE